MKKLLALVLLTAILTSCGSNNEIQETKIVWEKTSIDYVVWGKDNANINVYWNILSNNVKDISSNIAWKVTVLQCTEGQEVGYNTVIARISPDKNSLSYQNNVVQINSLKSQLSNLQQIRITTIANFDSKYRQLGLQESEIENQISSVNNTIWNDSQWIKNQLKIIQESKVLLEKNKASSLNNIDDSIINLKKTAFNTIESGLKRVGEIYNISDAANDLYENYENYLGAKNTTLKNQHVNNIQKLINDFKNQTDNFSEYSNQQLSLKISESAKLFKESSDVMDNSISSVGLLSQETIDGLYNEFLGISNQLITIKNNLDTLVNTRNTTEITFEAQQKELESSESQLLTQETSLNSSIKTLWNNNENLKEQYTDLENTKQSALKEMDINILNVQQAINQLNITFREDVLYAGTVGTVKKKLVSQNNNVQAWTPICTIVPKDNSLKLEIYSPQSLKKGMEFKYYYDGDLAGTGSIISESPVRNAQTQNYTYEGKIDFSNYKEWDYLDVKVISQVSSDEIWIPINYVFPKLDGYYVQFKTVDSVQDKKVEIWKMNNWEILILSGIDFWDTLQQ